MKTWTWIQPGDRVWKIISDPKNGTIVVYDEDGKEILKQQGLSEKALKMVEQNFIKLVALNMDNNFDPMYT